MCKFCGNHKILFYLPYIIFIYFNNSEFSVNFNNLSSISMTIDKSNGKRDASPREKPLKKWFTINCGFWNNFGWKLLFVQKLYCLNDLLYTTTICSSVKLRAKNGKSCENNNLIRYFRHKILSLIYLIHLIFAKL